MKRFILLTVLMPALFLMSDGSSRVSTAVNPAGDCRSASKHAALDERDQDIFSAITDNDCEECRSELNVPFDDLRNVPDANSAVTYYFDPWIYDPYYWDTWYLC